MAASLYSSVEVLVDMVPRLLLSLLTQHTEALSVKELMWVLQGSEELSLTSRMVDAVTIKDRDYYQVIRTLAGLVVVQIFHGPVEAQSNAVNWPIFDEVENLLGLYSMKTSKKMEKFAINTARR
ncbi:hypothetical protein NHX12_023850 [Muraenolepis orangiensis]|uniref:Uncharacterized protein n=1 Tax=Muraenolepis orangiensis TaxID=630683 RepID=A0A9Q0IQI1_9TELE|nr:hypothetical protein NHX12_023850 [Muraenolepis orangiensis]